MSIYVGTSGWSYAHWEGVLYPPGLPPQERLNFYLPRFPTVEVNSTFYRWPPDARFVRWHQRLPPNFLMTVKAPRGLTHGACLYSPEKWLQTVRIGLHHLGHHCGVLLVQLSPTFAYDYARLAYFLEHVPPEIRVAVELRHPSWQREEVFQLLERRGAAYCVMSGAHLPCVLRATASFVYVRLHGPDPDHLYAGSYSEADLTWWKERIQEWSHAGQDVFAYFNNDGEGNAVRNAERLQHLLGR
jgi:uncharacterized protein YecE (DUF72 family)